jgi:hypothetical protein
MMTEEVSPSAIPDGFVGEHCERVDAAQIAAELSDADPTVRARAVASVCPCRMDRMVFERFLSEVRRLRKDPDPQVRAAATHVLAESFQMQSEGQPTTPRMVTNEMARAKFHGRWRRDEAGDEEPGAASRIDRWRR